MNLDNQISSIFELTNLRELTKKTKTIKSITEPYVFDSALNQAKLFSESIHHTSTLSVMEEFSKTIKSITEPYVFDSALNQAKLVSESILGTSTLLGMEDRNQIFESINKPYNFGNTLKSIENLNKMFELSGSSVLDNIKLIEEFKSVNISELSIIYSEVNNKLKPYNTNIDTSTSYTRWISLEEFRRMLIEIITIYMFIMYVLNPSVELKDIENSDKQQALWLKEEFKKQTNVLTNLSIQKDKELYYRTVRDNIVLRSNPYIKKSTVKGRLNKNIDLLVLIRKDNWLKVEYFDELRQVTQTGWVHIKNLKRKEHK